MYRILSKNNGHPIRYTFKITCNEEIQKLNFVSNTFVIVLCISLRYTLAVHCLLQSKHETKYEGRDIELLNEETNLCN